ncbi:hypothetical protein D2H34_000425 [Vibrio fluvialis]
MDTKQFTEWYIENRPIYKRLANKVESILIEVLDDKKISYHIVTSRAKDIESARKKSSDVKYTSHTDIQDLSGIRVVTYVEDEVNQVNQIIEDLFDIDTRNSSNKSIDLGTDRVGYKSVHYVAKLKEDRLGLTEYKQYIDKVFEIQVRTILQHAWAEIEHDRNYKFSGELSTELTRRFKLLAGVLELADSEFNSISRDIDSITEDVSKGNMDIELSSSALTSFLKTKYKNIFDHFGLVQDIHGTGAVELKSFGIETIKQLDDIIPDDFDKFIKYFLNENNDEVVYELGLFRTLMIINDYHKYFSELSPTWTYWNSTVDIEDSKVIEYLKDKGVDWDDLINLYGIKYVRV